MFKLFSGNKKPKLPTRVGVFIPSKGCVWVKTHLSNLPHFVVTGFSPKANCADIDYISVSWRPFDREGQGVDRRRGDQVKAVYISVFEIA